MSDEHTETELTPAEREALARLNKRLARNAAQVEQGLEMIERLADSGMLAGTNSFLAEFDESFSALTRPDVMTMVANLMMLLGLLGQLPYEGGFRLAMDAPAAISEGYPRFRDRTEPMKLREAVAIMRSPDVAAALEMLVGVLRSQRGP